MAVGIPVMVLLFLVQQCYILQSESQGSGDPSQSMHAVHQRQTEPEGQAPSLCNESKLHKFFYVNTITNLPWHPDNGTSSVRSETDNESSSHNSDGKEENGCSDYQGDPNVADEEIGIKAASQDCCCICLEGYTPETLTCTPKVRECCHVFHKECLSQWIAANNSECPLCRALLLESSNHK